MPLKGAKGPVGTVIGVIAALLIFVVGHALNFGLNILGCFVHDLRLQCLEFFGKFYQDGGKRFEPLAFRTKYYNVAQQ
jgi:V/A-type H+-transporting ATPase subunit I